MPTVDSIRTHLIAYADPNDFGAERRTMLVRLETTDGIVGWGEGIAMWPEACKAAGTIVNDGLAPLVLNHDPRDVEALWTSMRDHIWWYGEGGIAGFALSAIDMALWDLKGQIEGKPLYEYFGGLAHARLAATASAHVNKATLRECVDEVAGFFERGFRSVKLGFAKKGLSKVGRDPDYDIEFVAALRSELGPDAEILIDAGNGVHWDRETAIRTVAAMAEQNIGWIEEPFYPTDIASYRALKSAVDVPIATGEREWTVTGYDRLLETGTVDIVGVDPARAEGVTGFHRVDQLVSRHGKTINAHAWSTAITTAASQHLSLASPNARLFEFKPFDVVVQQDLVRDPIRHVEGWMYPRDAPGLGISVDERVLDRLTIDKYAASSK